MIDNHETQEQVGRFRLFRQTAEGVKDNGIRMGLLLQLRADFRGEEWAVVPADQVPQNWQQTTILDGRLIEM